MDTRIVVIEDDAKLEDDGLIWELKDYFGDENVIFISKSNDGLQYIKSNLENNIIVLLDIDFPENEMNGHQLLAAITDVSKLIPVILWSGVDENKETFSDFINNHAFGFASKTTTTAEVMKLILKAVDFLNSSIDNTIEDWILQKCEDRDKPVYSTGHGKSYSLNQMLYEIRHQTEIGKTFSKRLTRLTIDLLLKNKEKLNG